MSELCPLLIRSNWPSQLTRMALLPQTKKPNRKETWNVIELSRLVWWAILSAKFFFHFNDSSRKRFLQVFGFVFERESISFYDCSSRWKFSSRFILRSKSLMRRKIGWAWGLLMRFGRREIIGQFGGISAGLPVAVTSLFGFINKLSSRKVTRSRIALFGSIYALSAAAAGAFKYEQKRLNNYRKRPAAGKHFCFETRAKPLRISLDRVVPRTWSATRGSPTWLTTIDRQRKHSIMLLAFFFESQVAGRGWMERETFSFWSFQSDADDPGPDELNKSQEKREIVTNFGRAGIKPGNRASRPCFEHHQQQSPWKFNESFECDFSPQRKHVAHEKKVVFPSPASSSFPPQPYQDGETPKKRREKRQI